MVTAIFGVIEYETGVSLLKYSYLVCMHSVSWIMKEMLIKVEIFWKYLFLEHNVLNRELSNICSGSCVMSHRLVIVYVPFSSQNEGECETSSTLAFPAACRDSCPWTF